MSYSKGESEMKRREALIGLGSSALIGGLLLNPRSASADDHHQHAKHYSNCAEECSKCMTECEDVGKIVSYLRENNMDDWL